MDARSDLFVPANRPERIAKALASGADAVVLDLEDAVAPDTKAAARQVIAQWAATAGDDERARILVRCNDAAGSHFAEDLRLLRDVRLPAVMLPKAEHEEQLASVHAAVPGVRLLPVAGVTPQFDDEARLMADFAWARRMLRRGGH